MQVVSRLQELPGTAKFIKTILAAEDPRSGRLTKAAAGLASRSLQLALEGLRPQLLAQGAKQARDMAQTHDWRLTADTLIRDLGLEGRVSETQRRALTDAFAASAARKAEALEVIVTSPGATLTEVISAGQQESEEGMAILEQLRADL